MSFILFFNIKQDKAYILFLKHEGNELRDFLLLNQPVILELISYSYL